MKVENWWPKLCTYAHEKAGCERQYGAWDCWQFVGGAVLVMTGVDYRPQFPAYATLDEGVAILDARGGVAEMLSGFFGAPKPVAFAQRGDIVICDLGDGPAGGVCVGVTTLTVAPAGLEPVKTLGGSLAWTVA